MRRLILRAFLMQRSSTAARNVGRAVRSRRINQAAIDAIPGIVSCRLLNRQRVVHRARDDQLDLFQHPFHKLKDDAVVLCIKSAGNQDLELVIHKLRRASMDFYANRHSYIGFTWTPVEDDQHPFDRQK